MSSDGKSDRMSRSVLRGFSPSAFRAARERAGMSRSDLVRLADIRTVETIRRWEMGAVSPQIDVLARALGAMRVVADEVIVTSPDSRYLSDWRHLRLLTQPQLAALAGLRTTLVQQLEAGTGTLTSERAVKLGRALKISAEEVEAAYLRARSRPPGTPA